MDLSEISRETIIEIMEKLLKYNGKTSKGNHDLLKNVVYKNAFDEFGIVSDDIELYHDPRNGRLSHGA